MNDVYHLLFEIPLTIGLGAIIAFLARNWIVERLKISLQRELEEFKSALLWDQKIKVEATNVAQYLSLAIDLKTPDDCKRANQLSWELAMWLPEEIYKKAVKSICNNNSEDNALSTVISVRKLLLKEKAGNLTQEDIAVHGIGIGAKT